VISKQQKAKNREAQARWRERHIRQRRTAQRVANLLVRRSWTDEHIREIAADPRAILPTRDIAALRRGAQAGDDERGPGPPPPRVGAMAA
jgi:hypothetical protein